MNEALTQCYAGLSLAGLVFLGWLAVEAGIALWWRFKRRRR